MDKRRIAIILVLSAGIALFFVHTYSPGHPIASIVGSPVAAQTPVTTSITVKSLPNISGDDDDPWHHFELTVPPSSLPLDIHLAFLVDGKGEDYVYEMNKVPAGPLPFKYRLDTIDTFRLEGAFNAQGYRLKKNVVTYYFAGTAGPGLVSGFNTTLRFKHEPGGFLSISPIKDNETVKATVGDKIVLENLLLTDTDFNGHYGPLPQLGSVPKTPVDTVHHLDVYVLFQPHQGPPMNGSLEKNI